MPLGPGPSDRAPIERRRDVLFHTCDELSEDLDVAGPLEAVLYATSDARDCDFMLRLSDVYSDGRPIFVAEGIIPARHRNGLDRSELQESDNVEETRVRCCPTSTVFQYAHRLRVTISSSSIPRISHNLQTEGDIADDTEANAVVSVQTVLYTKDCPPHLVLPVLPIKQCKSDRSVTACVQNPPHAAPAGSYWNRLSAFRVYLATFSILSLTPRPGSSGIAR